MKTTSSYQKVLVSEGLSYWESTVIYVNSWPNEGLSQANILNSHIIIILINRGLVGMLLTLVLLFLSALDVIFFFLPSPIDPKPVVRYGEKSLLYHNILPDK